MKLIFIPSNGSSSGGTAFRQSFVNADLVGGVLTVVHNLAQRYHSVTVYDDNEAQIIPDDVTDVDLNTVTIDLSSYGVLTGTWNVVVGG